MSTRRLASFGGCVRSEHGTQKPLLSASGTVLTPISEYSQKVNFLDVSIYSEIIPCVLCAFDKSLPVSKRTLKDRTTSM